MNKYATAIEINVDEIKQIMDEITEAQKRIIECAYKLERIGVVTIKETEATSGNWRLQAANPEILQFLG